MISYKIDEITTDLFITVIYWLYVENFSDIDPATCHILVSYSYMLNIATQLYLNDVSTLVYHLPRCT